MKEITLKLKVPEEVEESDLASFPFVGARYVHREEGEKSAFLVNLRSFKDFTSIARFLAEGINSVAVSVAEMISKSTGSNISSEVAEAHLLEEIQRHIGTTEEGVIYLDEQVGPEEPE